ncbi:MAG: phosphatidylglycerophosphatase A [Planctomycetota bacterium]
MKNGDTFSRLILTFLGSGYSPWAPGTVGSFAALVVGLAAWNFCPDSLRIYLFPSLALLASIACVLCGSRIVQIFGKKDPGAVVIDEVAGQYVTLSVFPFLSLSDYSPVGLAILWGLAFLLFRLLDILKPLGIRRLERLPQGWGVLLDDIAAGVVAAVLLYLGAPFLAAY